MMVEKEETVDPSQCELQLEELTKEELEYYVEAGFFYKAKNHKEHFAIQPFWLSQPETGILEEVNKKLGKWNSQLEAYVVAYEDVRSGTTLAAINEDHRWLHVDVILTFYLYKPEEGQQLTGIIRKKGHQAAICSLFNVFSATVYPQDNDELQSWSIGDEIQFSIYSFHNRRKGPIIRASSGGSTGKAKNLTQENWEDGSDQNPTNDDENWEENPEDQSKASEMRECSPKKKKKKKERLSKSINETDEAPMEVEVEEPVRKKKKKKDRLMENVGEVECTIDIPNVEGLQKKKKKSIKEEIEYLYQDTNIELISSPKKKHKKHKTNE